MLGDYVLEYNAETDQFYCRLYFLRVLYSVRTHNNKKWRLQGVEIHGRALLAFVCQSSVVLVFTRIIGNVLL